MIGLDTNVLVRYIMQDDRRQSPIATRCIESLSAESPGFVTTVVLIELGWVLQTAYALDRGQLVTAFDALLRAKEIIVEQAALVWKAIRLFQSSGADFADAMILIAAEAGGATRTVTFDRGAARRCGMQLLS